MRRLPVTHFTSVAGSFRAHSANDCVHFGNAFGPALNVPCPWRGHSFRASRRQRDVTSLLIRGVPPPCCVRLSWCFVLSSYWPKNVGCTDLTASIVAAPSANGVFSKWARGKRICFGAVPCERADDAGEVCEGQKRRRTLGWPATIARIKALSFRKIVSRLPHCAN